MLHLPFAVLHYYDIRREYRAVSVLKGETTSECHVPFLSSPGPHPQLRFLVCCHNNHAQSGTHFSGHQPCSTAACYSTLLWVETDGREVLERGTQNPGGKSFVDLRGERWCCELSLEHPRDKFLFLWLQSTLTSRKSSVFDSQASSLENDNMFYYIVLLV